MFVEYDLEQIRGFLHMMLETSRHEEDSLKLTLKCICFIWPTEQMKLLFCLF